MDFKTVRLVVEFRQQKLQDEIVKLEIGLAILKEVQVAGIQGRVKN